MLFPIIFTLLSSFPILDVSSKGINSVKIHLVTLKLFILTSSNLQFVAIKLVTSKSFILILSHNVADSNPACNILKHPSSAHKFLQCIVFLHPIPPFIISAPELLL